MFPNHTTSMFFYYVFICIIFFCCTTCTCDSLWVIEFISWTELIVLFYLYLIVFFDCILWLCSLIVFIHWLTSSDWFCPLDLCLILSAIDISDEGYRHNLLLYFTYYHFTERALSPYSSGLFFTEDSFLPGYSSKES